MEGSGMSEWTVIGFAAARPPDAPAKRKVRCLACGWTGRRYGECYYHPNGHREQVKMAPLDGADPCPRCGGQVEWIRAAA
jgi:hypothetical protein